MAQSINTENSLSRARTAQKHPLARLASWCLLLAALAAILTTGSAQALTLSDTARDKTWVTDGPVYAIARTADTIYIGGDFTQMMLLTGSGVPLDTSTGKPVAKFPIVKNAIRACTPDGAGGWFIGGGFTRVDDVSRNYLAHILADGSLDPIWNPGANESISALAISNGVVYVGGYFTSIGGKPRSYLAALDAKTGAVTAWNADVRGDQSHAPQITALAVSGGLLYVGGSFVQIGGQMRNNLAALDVATAAATAWDPSPNAIIYALAVSDGVVYAGGGFTQVKGQTHSFLAALDANTGAVTPWNPNPDGYVYALAISGGVIYAGGIFSHINGQDRKYLAALDVATGAPTAWYPSVENEDGYPNIQALAISGNIIYVGGYFKRIAGQPRACLAALDTSTGAATAWNPVLNDSVAALAVSGGVVYAGGYFSSVGALARNNLAALNAATGEPTAWSPDADNSVYALAAVDGTVYAGGRFSTIGGQPRNNLAALDAASGAATTWNPDAADRVAALAVSGSTVYAGGYFTSIGGQPRNHLAALDTASGAVTGWDPNANSLVTALAVSGSTVYAGGCFTVIGGQSRSSLAALDAASGAPTAWNSFGVERADGYAPVVYALAVAGGTVYVGGAFSSVGLLPRNNLAALDAATGAITPWNPNPDYSVYALDVLNDTVFAGGAFMHIGGQAHSGPAALDIVTGGARGWNPSSCNFSNQWGNTCNVYALAASAASVFAGGDFMMVDGENRPYLAQFDITSYNVNFVTDGTPGATLGGTTSQTVKPHYNARMVSAIAPTGCHFVKWTANGADYSTASPMMVANVTADMTLTAVFAPNTYTASFQTDGTAGATLTGAAAQTVTHGANCSAVTANAPTGCRFVKWTANGADYSTANPLSVTGVTGPLTLTACFEKIRYAVSFKTDGTRGATLTGTAAQTVFYGANATAVKANAPLGYRFVKWTKAGVAYSAANPLTVAKVTAALALTATFEKIKYTVSFKTDGTRGAKLTGTAAQTISYGGNATAVKAVAPAGYVFVKWTRAAVSYSTANPLTVRSVTANLTLTATFKRLVAARKK